MYRGKRTLDLVISIPAYALSLPIQALAALAVLLSLGRPVYFVQTRPGYKGVPFRMRKFRTMQNFDAEKGRTTDASRLTAVGRVLRSTSIDELPTLWNVIKGDMAIVGPRPLLMQYLDRYTSEQARRMDCPPGLTGLAQVNGRNAQTWDERFALDLRYVGRPSLMLDLRIIWQTIFAVLGRRGISAAGEATMPEFYGPSTGADKGGSTSI